MRLLLLSAALAAHITSAEIVDDLIDDDRNNKRTIALFQRMAAQPGTKKLTNEKKLTVLYRVLREGSGTESPVANMRETRPTVHVHLEGWAINNFEQKKYGAEPFLSTYNPPKKFAETHTAAAALKELDAANIKDRARPMWQVHGDLMLGLNMALQRMVVGDKWEVYLPAELCFFPNQRIAGNFLGSVAMNKFKKDLAKDGKDESSLGDGFEEDFKEMQEMQNEMGSELLGIDGIEDGDGLVFTLELLGTNATHTTPAQRSSTVAYQELDDSREALDEWIASSAGEEGSPPLVLGMLRQPTKGQLMHQFLKDAARTFSEQSRQVAVAMVAASKWDHKANKFTVSKLEAELKLKGAPGIYVSLDGGASWAKCDLGRNLKTLDPDRAQAIIEVCVGLRAKDEL